MTLYLSIEKKIVKSAALNSLVDRIKFIGDNKLDVLFFEK